MNFYKHYIGDFQRDTSHLSLTERGAYLALMQHYYATERPLPNDHSALCRIAGAFSKPERDAVKAVTLFFELRDGALWHKRIEAELEKQEHRNDTNRRIALEREARKRAMSEAQPLDNLRDTGAPDEHDSCSTRERSSHDQSTNQSQNQNTSSLRSDVERASPQRGSRLPPDWALPSDWAEWAKTARPDLDPAETARRFADYWHGIPGAKGRKADWLATWRNWVRNEKARSFQAPSRRVPAREDFDAIDYGVGVQDL
jgi:uncharacterized protein YdaU (DUF1376 family)